ncbi:MAG: GIY-YIG nuclease family protein [bacterium]|nr:GIY-YIG nuclease family protein [bacterium]
MFLEYGLNHQDRLVYVGDVSSGRTTLKCPYCREGLIARKGQQLAPHYAHSGPTCRPVGRPDDVARLPAYDRFNLSLQPKLLKALRDFADHFQWEPRLEERGLIKKKYGRYGYELTKLGKIPLGQLSLSLFAEEQQKMIEGKHSELERQAFAMPEDKTAETDLKLYRSQWKRVLFLTLYFLEVKHDTGILHKIGVTSRGIDERIREIKNDLSAIGLRNISIAILGTWAHRGNIEPYFKHRYGSYQDRTLQTLTEYFQFPPDALKKVLRDLRRMKAKEMSNQELGILSDQPPFFCLGIPFSPLLHSWEYRALTNVVIHSHQSKFDTNILDEISRRDNKMLQWFSGGYLLSEYGQRYLQAFGWFYQQLYEIPNHQ